MVSRKVNKERCETNRKYLLMIEYQSQQRGELGVRVCGR